MDSIPITWSSLSSLIPITPCDTLPIGLTSFSSKVIHIPSLVTSTTSIRAKEEVEKVLQEWQQEKKIL